MCVKENLERNLREIYRCRPERQERKVEAGDVVVVGDDEEKKRGEWKMGVVDGLVKGKNCEIRGGETNPPLKTRPQT